MYLLPEYPFEHFMMYHVRVPQRNKHLILLSWIILYLSVIDRHKSLDNSTEEEMEC